jgi:AcrR family transcriptional regulator
MLVKKQDVDFDLIWTRDTADLADKGKPPLSREQIVRAAMDLADASGLESVSIRRIAARLDAGPTSLYWHVRSKDDLYELMFDAAYAEVVFPEPSGDWRADLRLCALRIHQVLSDHPWLVLLGIQPAMGPNIRRFSAFATSVLGPAGLDRRDRIEIIAIVNNYLLGFAHRRTAWEGLRERVGLNEEQWQARLERYLEQARESNPELAADIETRLHLSSEESFELGLDCVLDGIAARFGIRPPG